MELQLIEIGTQSAAVQVKVPNNCLGLRVQGNRFFALMEIDPTGTQVMDVFFHVLQVGDTVPSGAVYYCGNSTLGVTEYFMYHEDRGIVGQ